MNVTSDVLKRIGPPPPRPDFADLPIRPSLVKGISDPMLALILPVVVYWTYCTFFHIIDQANIWAKYRLHTPDELTQKNKVTLAEVLRAVALQHIVQTIAGVIVDQFEPPLRTGHEPFEIWDLARRLGVPIAAASFIYNWAIPAFKLSVAVFIMDTWQFMLHRYMHLNKFLYKHLHSVHHRLYVPYAYGALYNSLIEGLLLDTAGAGLGLLLVGLTPRESMIFFTVSTMKTVDDHCGYKLPYDPFQWLFPNNAAYHDIHHQRFGIKSNFSQPFFIHWDAIFNTVYPKYEEYIAQQELKRVEKYNLHLEEMEKKRQQADKSQKQQ